MTIYEQIAFPDYNTVRESQNGGGWYSKTTGSEFQGETWQLVEHIPQLSQSVFDQKRGNRSGSNWGEWHNNPTWYKKWDTSIPAPPAPQELRVMFYPEGNVHTNQNLKVFFYPDNNVEQYQKLDVYYFPDGNTQDVPVDKQLDVWFYPNQNVQDMAILQELKVWFYPENNVEDTPPPPPSDGLYKFWFGMKGKRKYGKSHIKRVRL